MSNLNEMILSVTYFRFLIVDTTTTFGDKAVLSLRLLEPTLAVSIKIAAIKSTQDFFKMNRYLNSTLPGLLMSRPKKMDFIDVDLYFFQKLYI